MPRLMSFAKTADQLAAGEKTVTRRDGWRDLKPGTVLKAVDRSPRSGKGFQLLCHIEVTSVRCERLGDITPDDLVLEGFPQMEPEDFVELYCAPRAPEPDREVTRIEFRRAEEDEL